MKKQYIQPATTMVVANLQTRLMAASNGGADANIGGGSGGSDDSKNDQTGSSSDKDEYDGGTGAKYNAWSEWED